MRSLTIKIANDNPELLVILAAIAELTIGSPALVATDIGPVINAGAPKALKHHAARTVPRPG
jgi:delta 1-pyrroline-5-carboxylate dehydrogenase